MRPADPRDAVRNLRQNTETDEHRHPPVWSASFVAGASSGPREPLRDRLASKHVCAIQVDILIRELRNAMPAGRRPPVAAAVAPSTRTSVAGAGGSTPAPWANRAAAEPRAPASQTGWTTVGRSSNATSIQQQDQQQQQQQQSEPFPGFLFAVSASNLDELLERKLVAQTSDKLAIMSRIDTAVSISMPLAFDSSVTAFCLTVVAPRRPCSFVLRK